HFTANGQTIHTRHHQVQNHQTRFTLGKTVICFLPIMKHTDLKTSSFQIVSHQLCKFDFIFNQHDMFHQYISFRVSFVYENSVCSVNHRVVNAQSLSCHPEPA